MSTAAPFLFDRLEATLEELSRLVTQLRESTDVDSSTRRESQPEYLSVKQLAARIPYKEHTIRNLISAGEFQEGLHYYKRRGRVMFSWPAMQGWVEKHDAPRPDAIPLVRSRYAHSR
jgi:hypothetical protein